MLSTQTIITFFSASVLLALAPGPDNLFVLTQAALRGRLAGIFVVLGLCTGILGHTALVACGVAVIFQVSTIAFSLLKICGAAYLLYLAWGAFRAPAEQLASGGEGGLRPGQLYRRGILMNLTNPKVSIFFLAFLPQFADPARGPISLQMLLLGGLFIVATLLIFGLIALLAGTLGGLLNRSPRVQLVMNRLAGVVFVGLALKLAGAQR